MSTLAFRAVSRSQRCSFKAHQLRVHKRKSIEQFYVRGSVCQNCQTDYRTRVRCLSHVALTRCFEAIGAGKLEHQKLSPEEVEELAKADQGHRRRCKALGVGEKTGPPAIRASGKVA